MPSLTPRTILASIALAIAAASVTVGVSIADDGSQVDVARPAAEVDAGDD